MTVGVSAWHSGEEFSIDFFFFSALQLACKVWYGPSSPFKVTTIFDQSYVLEYQIFCQYRQRASRIRMTQTAWKNATLAIHSNVIMRVS